MVNAQEWLDKEYPKEERKSIKELDISRLDEETVSEIMEINFDYDFLFRGQRELIMPEDLAENIEFEVKDNVVTTCFNSHNYYLDGALDLRDFVNLRKLDCSNNKITSLDLSNCAQLTALDCSNNCLASLDVSHNSQLKYVDAEENKIVANLSIFSHLHNLKALNLKADSLLSQMRRVVSASDLPENTNDFSGSLQSLTNCSPLRVLNIDYLEKVSGSFEWLARQNFQQFGCKGTIFAEQLEPFEYDIKKWKIFFTNFADKISALEKELHQTKEQATQNQANSAQKIQQLQEQVQMLTKTNQNLCEELQMERENQEEALVVAAKWHKNQKSVLLEENRQQEAKIQQLEKQLTQLQISELELQTQIQIPPKKNI